jgi:acetyl esterase/lipase
MFAVLLVAVLWAKGMAGGAPPPLPPAALLSWLEVVSPFAAAESAPTPGGVERDVVYAHISGVDLRLDVYYPTTWRAPAPLAVFVHGGGWTSGDKSTSAGLIDKDELVGRGYVVASINYRLAPQYKWPAQIEDAKAAIRFLRANAARFGVDPARIGVWGSSAGGHLVAMLGAADANAGFDGSGGNDGVSSRVTAVVDQFGPADLTAADWGLSRSATASQVFGATSPNDPVLVSASPVTYVTPDDPPFLIQHGEKDAVVPLSQSQILLARLLAAGVPASLTVVENAGHGFAATGGAISPTRLELSRQLADFFDRYVKNSGHAPHRHLRATR